jgi:hypothetical protein
LKGKEVRFVLEEDLKVSLMVDEVVRLAFLYPGVPGTVKFQSALGTLIPL